MLLKLLIYFQGPNSATNPAAASPLASDHGQQDPGDEHQPPAVSLRPALQPSGSVLTGPHV